MRRPDVSKEQAHVVVMADVFPKLSETFVLAQVQALIERGFNVHVLARLRPARGAEDQIRGPRPDVVYLEDGAGPLRYLPRRVRRRLPARLQGYAYATILRNAKLVICHFGPNGNQAARELRGYPKPKLWTIFHGYDVSSYVQRAGGKVYERLFKRGDRFFAVSRLWMRKLEELRAPPSRIHLLRMGVDVKQIPFSPSQFDFKAGLKILTVCRLVEKKGTETTLRALAVVRRMRPELRWSFEIVGDGPLAAPLKRLSQDLGLSDHVHFAGPAAPSTIKAKLAQCDLFVLPSVTAANGDMEGVPVALMEAMAAGVLVLSTFHSGIPELVEHGVSGLLTEERDAEGLAENLLRLVDEPELRISMAKAARKKVENEFNQSAIMDEFASELGRALGCD